MSDDVGAHIQKLYDLVSHLHGVIERTHRPGTVTDVDYSDKTKPRIRIQIGVDADGQPVKSPWVPHMQHAGARSIHAPVTKGQQMLLLSPDGNFENGVAVPYGFSKPVPSPSDKPDQHVDAFGKVTTTLTDSSHARAVDKMKVTHDTNGLTFDLDGTKFAFSKAGLKVDGGDLQHNGKNIGSSHVHGQVKSGSDDTGPPEAA